MIGNYYYALPMYLNREIPIVANWDNLNFHTMSDNWERQIYDGVRHNKGDFPKTLLTFSKFKQLWDAAPANNILAISAIPPGKRFSSLVGNDNYKVIGRIPRRGAYLIVKVPQKDKSL